MFVPIVSLSALEYWLYGFDRDRFFLPNHLKHKRCSLPKDFSAEFSIPFIKDLALMHGLSLPVHIMVADEISRRNSNLIKCHIRPNKLPPNSFVQLDRSILLASPEYSLTQVANTYSFHLLVELINTLCANYFTNNNAKYNQHFRDPITNTAAIKKYIHTSTRLTGKRVLEQALQYSLDHSFSPMESSLAVPLMLPFTRGGYAVKTPELNMNITLSSKSARLLGRDSVCTDIGWKEDKLVLEYDSNLTHLEPDQHSYDKRKQTALILDGYKVIAVTYDQINSLKKMDELFISIRRELGMRSATKELEKYRDLRWNVIHDLFFSKQKSLQ